MGQKLGGLWGRVQGNNQLRMICDKIFTECLEYEGNICGDDDYERDRQLLPLNDLHRAILLAYNFLNVYFTGPYKEPPSTIEVRRVIETYRRRGVEAIDREQFHELIRKSASRDLQKLFLTKVGLAIMISPGLTNFTKTSGKTIPRIGKMVEKIPSPILITTYTICLVILQDIRAFKT